MKKVFLLISIILSFFKINAQGFNGSIEFKNFTLKDTTTNIYYVKEKLIKLDQMAKKANSIEGSFIFDLNANKIKFVSPLRKVWGEHKSETPPIIRGVCEVIKGSNIKSVSGVKCKDYIVKNMEENTTITYWIAEGKYSFFIPMMKLWNRKDKQSVYFTQIRDLSEGSMPLLSEEKQISDGKVVTRLEVTKINRKTPDNTSLEVPSSYTKFE